MTSEGLSSVCAKLEPASSKNSEILEINVLQKFTSHALYKLSWPFDCFSKQEEIKNVFDHINEVTVPGGSLSSLVKKFFCKTQRRILIHLTLIR